ncbi:uncharacterized protein WM277_026278 isoform 2-T2 [Molossus nigricans]
MCQHWGAGDASETTQICTGRGIWAFPVEVFSQLTSCGCLPHTSQVEKDMSGSCLVYNERPVNERETESGGREWIYPGSQSSRTEVKSFSSRTFLPRPSAGHHCLIVPPFLRWTKAQMSSWEGKAEWSSRKRLEAAEFIQKKAQLRAAESSEGTSQGALLPSLATRVQTATNPLLLTSISYQL